jgi:gamma-glutamyltranspeptidase/glutathione hydrolase
MKRTSAVLAATLALASATAATASADKPQGHEHGHGQGHPPAVPTGKVPTAVGSGGAAATVDLLATQAAIDMLRKGGNAVDAAVAAAGVLGVTEPFSSGVGGGGFMVIRTKHGQITTIDSRETAPATMRPDSFMVNGVPLSFNDARFSGLSAGIPGTVRGWELALDRYGHKSLSKALEAGTRVAREGFLVDQTFFDQTQANVDYFDDVPSTAAIYLDPDGTPRDIGTTLRNPDLARTYEYLARYGPDAFYRGPLAKAIADAAQHPPIAPSANHVWRPGLMQERDLAAYRAIERPPTHVNYRGLDVWSMGPPSSGGSTVGEALNILEGYQPLGADRIQALHRFLEASRYAFADRGRYLADPAYVNVPLQCLLSDQFASARRALITERAATSPVAPGDCGPVVFTERDTEGLSTTHLTVVDKHGMAVAYTFTIESTGGNAIVVPGWGLMLNNELTDFDYSSLTAANRANGGKRPRSSISPTIVTRGGEPVLAVGSPGGSTIITTVLQVLLERFDLGKTLPEAIAASRLSQRNTATTSVESTFPAAERAGLAARGHLFAAPAEIGAVTGVEFLGRDRLLAAAEPVRRGGGSAMVVSDR